MLCLVFSFIYPLVMSFNTYRENANYKAKFS